MTDITSPNGRLDRKRSFERVRKLAKEDKAALQKVAARLSFEVIHYDLNTIDDLEGAFVAGIRDDVSAFRDGMTRVSACNSAIAFIRQRAVARTIWMTWHGIVRC